jgi:hypothetical protein
MWFSSLQTKKTAKDTYWALATSKVDSRNPQEHFVAVTVVTSHDNEFGAHAPFCAALVGFGLPFLSIRWAHRIKMPINRTERCLKAVPTLISTKAD